ncbi:MAG: di-heme oxidoredictase family protein [Stappiaceae bacterium]
MMSLSGLLVLMPAFAEEYKPWAERTILEHLRFEDFAGKTAERQDALIDRGQALFVAKFTDLDGAGRPMATQAILATKRRRPAPQDFQRLSGPDANSCASCHNDPAVGGAGHFTANVFVSEGFESADFDTSDPQFSNERGTNALHGAGLVELLAREMTADLHSQRKAALADARRSETPVEKELVSKDVRFGSIIANPDGTLDVSKIEGVDTDLTLRPFGQKGVFASLRQFTVNAMNHHHGMQAEERFGTQWTGSADFDEDRVESELSRGDISALVAWQATLKPPGRNGDIPSEWQQASERGEVVFAQAGCAECHRPTLPLKSLSFTDPGPYEVAGTLRPEETSTGIVHNLALEEWSKSLERDEYGNWLVPLFGDLKRHRISGKRQNAFGNELLGQRFVDRDVFLTTELWGVDTTGPYGHRGDITTLDQAILSHGGEALNSRDAYAALPDKDRDSLIAFLRTLIIEP